jgi:hypothetical protein
MAITRLGVANPAANTATNLYSASYATLASVLVSNKSTSTSIVPTVSVYVVPSGASVDSQYAYIVANLSVSAGQSFETFKFAINTSDSVFVKSTTSSVSFSINGLVQADDFTAGDYPLTFTNKTIKGSANTLYLDSGNTASRSASAQIGYVRYNTDLQALEVLTSSGWKTVSAS